MENITLGQIGLAVAFLAALIGGITTLLRQIRQWISAAMHEQIEPLRRDIDDLSRRVDAVDMQGCKNFLVRVLSDIERGNGIGDIEKERLFEQYQHYVDHGGNSYIKTRVEKLQNAGKL